MTKALLTVPGPSTIGERFQLFSTSRDTAFRVKYLILQLKNYVLIFNTSIEELKTNHSKDIDAEAITLVFTNRHVPLALGRAKSKKWLKNTL